jgi:TonB-linked SusC/RagA family outer membrane protein
MRFIKIFYIKRRYIGLLLLSVLMTGAISAQEKPQSKAKMITVSLKVVDDNSAPISKAKVVVGEGMIHAETDQNGSLSFSAYPADFVTIMASGYEKSVSLVQDIVVSNTIKLAKSKLFMTSDDEIPLPYITLKKRNITGSSSLITGDQLERYPSTDIRNAMAGLATGLQIVEKNGAPGMTAEENNGAYRYLEKISVMSRGYRMIYIVDDVPVDATEIQIDPGEIESMTIIKDIVGKAMFGSAGAGGIILIKTKRGRTNERILNINLEDGVSTIDRFPGWASGAEYATLNNQARETDGLKKKYLDSDITDYYAKNDPYDMYHPSVNYKDIMLKNTMPFRRANVASSGGNDVIQYAAYLGYSGEGDIYKLGAVSDYNRFNSRANLDIRINDIFKVRFDIFAGLSFRRSPNYGYATSEGSGLTDLVEFSSAIVNITDTPPVEFPIYANNDPNLKAPWYAVSTNYPINPVGNLVENGFYNERGRTGVASAALDYDMKGILDGLTSTSFLSFSALNLVRIGQAEDYIAYTVTPGLSPTTGKDTVILAKVHDGVDNANLYNLHDYYYQRFAFYERFKYENTFGENKIQSTLTYFLNQYTRNGYRDPRRQQNIALTGLYSIKDKYSIQALLNYTGSSSFDEGKRYELFPSLGASWVISEESFMSNLKAVNYLKLRAEAGILGSESFMAPFLYNTAWTGTTGTTFGPSSLTTRWFGSTNESTVYSTYPNRFGNQDLTWEKRKELSVGLDALMLKEKLSLEITYFNNLRDGQITQLINSVPYVTGVSGVSPRYNYNSTKYFGIEAGIQYTENISDFGYSIGGNVTIQNSKLLKYDEPAYRYDYQIRTGLPTDTYWGQICLGKFETDAEALTVPQLYDAVLKKGDLKYKDMNGDGFIDDNDMSEIGHTTPRLYYALNAKLSYKNFDLTIIGTGFAFFDVPLTSKYYWPVTGAPDNNYSNFMKNNIGGAFPRLTYYKVANNFVASDFWLTRGDYFKIQNIELAYTLTADKLQSIRSRGIRFYLRGSNLLTISKVKDIDPESPTSGIDSYPLFRTISGGVKLTF